MANKLLEMGILVLLLLVYQTNAEENNEVIVKNIDFNWFFTMKCIAEILFNLKTSLSLTHVC